MTTNRTLESVMDKVNELNIEIAPGSTKAGMPSESLSDAKQTPNIKLEMNDQSKQLNDEKTNDERQKQSISESPKPLSEAANSKQQESLNEQLFSAVRSGYIDSIKQLVKDGANVNAKDERGDPILFSALHTRQRKKVLKLLLKLGANPNCINAEGRTLLLEAVIDTLGDHSTSVLSTLLDGGADVNFVNEAYDECPALWTMITNGNDEQINLFLNHGADVTTLDKKGKSILSFVAQLDTDTVPMKDWQLDRFIIKYMRILRSRGAKLTPADIDPEEYHNPLKKYLECGEAKEAREFIKYYRKGYRGVEEPLHLAVMNPRTSCLKTLLKSGLFDVNERDEGGSTVLHDAANTENEGNIEALLEYGADPNIMDGRGDTPRNIAKYEKNQNFIDLLEDYGAKKPHRESDETDTDEEELIEEFLGRGPHRRPDCVIS